MNKRKKATNEVKHYKLLKHLSSIIENEEIDKLQKKSLVHEIEIYKQKNNDLFNNNENLKLENKIFFGIINYLIKNEKIDFIEKILLENDQEIFYKRILDCINKIKKLKSKKRKNYNLKINKEDSNKHNSDSSTKEENLNNLENENDLEIKKIFNEIEQTMISKLKEENCEKENLIHFLQKKILDYELEKKENSMIQEENKKIDENISVGKLLELIKTEEREKIKNLNFELENLKFKIENCEKIMQEKNEIEKKIEEKNKLIENFDIQFQELMHKNDVFCKNLKNKLKEIEENKNEKFLFFENQINEKNETISLLKSEINEQNNLIEFSKGNKDEKIISLSKELEEFKKSKNVLEFEKKEISAEKLRLKNELKKIGILEAKFNSEIISLKSDLQNRINAAAYHKKNFLKNEHELKFLLKNNSKSENQKILENENISLKCENKLLKEDISNYKLVFKELNQTSPENVESVEKYRKLLRCPTCDSNYKDTVINKCMHVLCRDCVENRLKTRNRKCPICAESFCSTDVKRIFL